ncbi:MOSC domain-containing protein [Hydrogenophaga aquatica]
MTEFASSEATLPLYIEELWTYPVKSCAGVRLSSVELLDTGLEWDRSWMVVDERNEFVSQRELPQMALIQPRFRMGHLELRAPGMLSLHLALDAAEAPRRVRVWDDEVDAYDMGDVAAQWFTDFLGSRAPSGMQRLRLVRFDPEVRRLSSLKWTAGVEAPNQFSDGFPVLVLSRASLDELNGRLTALGHAAAGVERFRPNIVLGGLEAHDEDRLASLRLRAEGVPDAPPVWLQPVKPCSRCSIPDIDPATGEPGSLVSPVLHAYRQDRRLMGAVTFGMNAIVRGGAGQMLHEGMKGEGEWGPWEG